MTPAIDDQDVRNQHVRLRVSAREKALIEQLAEEDGLSVSAWVLERLIPVLEKRKGYVDMARRKAPRRPNRGKRGEQQR